MIQKKNVKGVSTYYEYDVLGRLIREKAPTANDKIAITRSIYDAAGNKIKEIELKYYDSTKDTSDLIHTMIGLSYTYDNMNRLKSIMSPEGNIIEYRKYDARGNLKKVVDGLRYTGNMETSPGNIYIYDHLNRLTCIKDEKENAIYYKYDLMNNLLEKTDAKNNKTKFEYNSDGTLAKMIFSDRGIVEYTYDKLGRKLTEKDPLGNITFYSYNGFGQVISVKDSYNHSIEYEYDANSNLIRERDKKGNETTYIYDQKNRLIEKKNTP
ncbi:RHS repeat protein [Inediibacterium massiliense]|uniref:RHS repeat protein n=1 Tax=Inediibacterium massiliense TaxID=1658111 RepID=UPI0006B4015F|nr:RHS repeat protein [Inediibacterium massiliense]